MLEIRKESVVGLGIFPELPVGMPHLGKKLTAAVRRHHAVRRAVKDEEWD